MPDASFVQSSFLGGEWSLYAQGRFDKPEYRTAMAVCLNSLPLEEGACTRRPGQRFLGTTRSGAEGKLLPFDFTAAAPYNVEFTDSHLRFFGSVVDGPISVVTTNDDVVVSSISTAKPAVMTTASAVTWATGDQVFFKLSANVAATYAPLIRNRQFILTKLTTTTFSLADAITGAAIDGSLLGWGSGAGTGNSVSVARIHDVASPYTGLNWTSVRSVQSDLGAMLLHASFQPRLLSETPPTTTAFASFALTTPVFTDGPYLDPVDLTATVSALTGDVTFTIPMSALFTFKTTDVGRMVRIFSQPSPWNVLTAYVQGNFVSYKDGFYVALGSSTGAAPDASPTSWAVSNTATTWTWGVIKTYLSAQTATLTIKGPDILYNNTILIWQVGVFSDTTGWPTCGTFHEGRLWLSGAVPNRIDSSNSNDTLNMAPTSADGTVSDSNSISYTFNATDSNPIFWMQPAASGIVCGSQGGEWLIQASALNDPLTPTSVQAHRVTKYGCANIEPRETGLTLTFVQRWKRKLFEYFPDVFSGRYMAPNLSTNAAHITHSGIAEIAFQKERTPIIWSRTEDGDLAGTTYKRDSLMSSQGPTFVAWHRHELGSGHTVESICVGPSQFSNLDGLSLVTNGNTNVRHVGMLTDVFDESDLLSSAWYLDDAIVPAGGVVDAVAKTITFNGLWHLNGQTVSAFVGGIDAGDALVSNGAAAFTYYDGLEGTFSLDYLRQISGNMASNAPGAINLTTHIDVPVAGDTTSYIERFSVPAIVGFTYKSQGQGLRRVAPQDAGAANGPALGKTTRQHQFVALLANAVTGTVKFGTDFDHMRVAAFKTRGQKPYLETQLFSGVHQGTLDDEYSFDSMLCWQITRPLPLTVVAFGGFVNTQDR